MSVQRFLFSWDLPFFLFFLLKEWKWTIVSGSYERIKKFCFVFDYTHVSLFVASTLTCMYLCMVVLPAHTFNFLPSYQISDLLVFDKLMKVRVQ